MGDIDLMLANFDSSDEENDLEEQPSTSTADPFKPSKMVPLDFEGGASSGETATDQRTKLLSDSEDEDELIEKKKELSETGRNIERLLKKQDEKLQDNKRLKSISQMARQYTVPAPPKESRPVTTLRVEETKKPSVVDYDPFFKFHIRNPKVSSEMFESLAEGVAKQRLSTLKRSTSYPDGFITMGVLIEKSDIKKSANGNQFIIWKLHDLRDCQQPPVKCLLFGEAYKNHHTLLPGNVLAFVNPQIADPDPKEKLLVFKLVRSAQIVEIGWSSDYGICRGMKADGVRCLNFVNVSLSEFCVYHIMSQAKKLSAKRGAFGTTCGAPPIKKQENLMIQPGIAQIKSSLPTMRKDNLVPVTKQDEKKNLSSVVSSRAYLLGSRNLVKLQQSKQPTIKNNIPLAAGSIGDFLKENTVAIEEKRMEHLRRIRITALKAEKAPVLTPNRESMIKPDLTQTRNDQVKHRAAAILRLDRERDLKGNGGSKRGTKRSADQCESDISKLVELNNKENLTSDALLSRKSKFSNAVDKAESDALDRYMTGMEAREKVETFVTTTMSVKNLSVVSCKACGYTAQAQSDFCRQSGHVVVKHKAEKRFFKCKQCKRRIVSFGMLPTRPCENCAISDWERVAMKDERKTALDRDKLKIRGDEMKYVSI